MEQLNKRIFWTYWILLFQGILIENVFWPHEAYHDYRLISSEINEKNNIPVRQNITL